MSINTDFQTDSPTGARQSIFIVKALNDFPGRFILAGDYVTIDPSTTPANGNIVLVDKTLDEWSGQADISGVAIAVGRDM